MRYRVFHRTTYRYSEPVSLGHSLAYLRPRTTPTQRCLAYQLTIEPPPDGMQPWTDYFGNQASFFAIEEAHRELVISARSEVLVQMPSPPAPEATPAWDRLELSLAAAPFTFSSPYVPRNEVLAAYARSSFPPTRPILAAALDLTGRIFRDFKYDSSATGVNTPTMEVFQKRRGVCQDFAHLEIACLRSLGLPARYVSGYLRTDPPPGKPRLIGADASHAWLSVFCPGHGWLDLDPTNNQMPGGRHVTLAWGRDYGDVCPVKGVVLGGGHHAVSVAVDVVADDEPAELGDNCCAVGR